MTANSIDEEENIARMERGELFYAFTPRLTADRRRCGRAVNKFNSAGDLTRREIVEHWNDITKNTVTLPPPGATEEEEDAILQDFPWVERPIRIDYGYNVKTGRNVFINYNCTIVDTCTVFIGSRTLLAPNVSLYAGGHPIDPEFRDGTAGPELGAPITIGEDCWIGGDVTILAGVTIGNGCTIGAGSLVNKDIPPYHVAAGNPARIIRPVERKRKAELEAKQAA